jgi:PAS domain S-box-containing protein
VPFWLLFIAQSSDPLSGGAGWAGAGLLGLLLAWLLLKHLPDKDRQLSELIKDYNERVERVREYYTRAMEVQSDRTDSKYKEVLALLTRNNESAREAVHAIRNLHNTIAMKQRLADAFQSLEVAAWTKALDGTLISWNTACESLFGWKQGEVVGRSIYDRIIPPECRGEEQDVLRRIGLGETVEPYQTVRMGKGGQRFTICVVTSPIRDQSGRVIGASTIVHNEQQ